VPVQDSAIIYQQAPVGAPWDDCRSGLCNLHRVLFDPNKPSASALGKPTQIGDSINGLGEVHWPWYDPLAASGHLCQLAHLRSTPTAATAPRTTSSACATR
jgi:hypothetical protein